MDRDLKTILISGGAGFIGSNFIYYLLQAHSDYKILNLDKLTYAANLSNLQDISDENRYLFIRGDTGDKALLEEIFHCFDVRGVIHFAAESHVDNSIAGPDVFIQSNVNGTFTLLDVARQYWMSAPGQFRLGYEGCRFLQISTDEVYGSLGETGYFTETTPYAPRSPYSASKAAADLIVQSYFCTYDMDVVITHCSNNYGPRQHREKLIPTIIRKALALQPIPIYGDGKNVRDWIYVEDHCRAIDQVFHWGKAGRTYNIGGMNERTNSKIAEIICDMLDQMAVQEKAGSNIKSYRELITFVKDRPGHDQRYALDITRINNELGWQPQTDFRSGLLQTIDWYLRQHRSLGLAQGETKI